MSASYQKINYSTRPAKAIERKMLAEAIACLRTFRDPSTYRYIGFGSTYFSDFQLFHKTLGLKDMVSIEKDEENKERFHFNKPFDCIKLVFDESTQALPKLIETDIPSIIWLDYDGPLNEEVLTDIRTVFTQVPSGSLFLYSVNAHPPSRETCKSRVDEFKNRVGPDKFPTDISERDLAQWGSANVTRRIVHNEIEETLFARNSPRPDGARFEFRQLFNFHYADGAKMLTSGGMLIDAGMKSLLSSSGLENLDFSRDSEEPYRIRVPNLTRRETQYLDKSLPGGSIDQNLGIPVEDISEYRKVYRYFPSFSEVLA